MAFIKALLPVALMSAVLILGTATEGMADMTEDEVRQGFEEHAAAAQFYRWYQVYERPEGGIGNALDILSDDVSVTSSLGTANGRDEYAARVSQLPDTWHNAHHVKSTAFTRDADGALMLNAEITYQNTGMLPDNAVRQAELSYAISFERSESGVLPLLSSVAIAPNGDAIENGDAAFEDAYAANRMLSLVHYWLALIEDPARDPEPVREILADTFSLNFSSGAITDFEGFKDWLAGPGSQVAASTHVVENFSARHVEGQTYALSVDFDWTGITPDGTVLVAKTRHNWTAVNDVTERFARIKTVDVEVLESFRPRGN